MQIDIISVLPELMESFINHSIVQRAKDKAIVKINLISLRKYGQGNYKSIDDAPYGGGGGMVMAVEPLANCIDDCFKKHTYDACIYLTPDGLPLKQQMANTLSTKQKLLLLAGHYKGIDERIREEYVTQEISIGDYVLSGGELPAVVLADAIVRLVPGVLSDETSALTDSFQDGLLAPPVYTRPAVWRGKIVPKVLTNGHAKEIADWRHEQALMKTKKQRPDLLNPS